MKTPGQHLALMRLAKPIIAAVNGWCLGGGMWYALCSDITIASERAVFGQPEVREIQNSTFLLAALAGWKVAHRYALTGDHFDAAEALRIGIVNEVVAPDALMGAATALARRIALMRRTRYAQQGDHNLWARSNGAEGGTRHCRFALGHRPRLSRCGGPGRIAPTQENSRATGIAFAPRRPLRTRARRPA